MLNIADEEGPEIKALMKSKPERQPLLTVQQVAAILNTSRGTVTRMVIEGQLPAIKLRSGKRKKMYRVRREVLDRWILTKERKPG